VSLILLFLTAAVTLPDGAPEAGIDLGAYFEEKQELFLDGLRSLRLSCAPLIERSYRYDMVALPLACRAARRSLTTPL
jgi:hypothetical protein